MTSFNILPGETIEERAGKIMNTISGGTCYCSGGENASCLYCFTLAQLKTVEAETANKALQERCCQACGRLWIVYPDGRIPPCPYCVVDQLAKDLLGIESNHLDGRCPSFYEEPCNCHVKELVDRRIAGLRR